MPRGLKLWGETLSSKDIKSYWRSLKASIVVKLSKKKNILASLKDFSAHLCKTVVTRKTKGNENKHEEKTSHCASLSSAGMSIKTWPSCTRSCRREVGKIMELLLSLQQVVTHSQSVCNALLQYERSTRHNKRVSWNTPVIIWNYVGTIY